jgi:hypothetical protein
LQGNPLAQDALQHVVLAGDDPVQICLFAIHDDLGMSLLVRSLDESQQFLGYDTPEGNRKEMPPALASAGKKKPALNCCDRGGRYQQKPPRVARGGVVRPAITVS